MRPRTVRAGVEESTPAEAAAATVKIPTHLVPSPVHGAGWERSRSAGPSAGCRVAVHPGVGTTPGPQGSGAGGSRRCRGPRRGSADTAALCGLGP